MGSGAATRQEVEKLIGKDRLKDAVKQAKLLFKDQGTPENHQLLERAYFLRARQLVALGMPDSAIEVARHLLEFGLTTDEWVDDFVRLLMTLGLTDQAFEIQARSGSPEMKDQLAMLAADQAVIHPERMRDISPEMAREAGLIRQSLEKLQAGDDERGLALLRDLPRSSPLSDWKFFVRGLAAHYRGNSAEAQSNWDRLDENRKPRQIVNRLLRLSDIHEKTGADADLALLEKVAYGEPVLPRLSELQSMLANHDWDKVNRLLVLLRHSLRRLDPKLAERLTRILIVHLLREASEQDLDEAERFLSTFTRLAEPLAIDPHWNRFWAIATDMTEAEGATARGFWTKYTHDLETIPALSPAERPWLKRWSGIAWPGCIVTR